MNPDLEQRRLAIIRALRGEDRPEPSPDRVARLEADVAEVRRAIDQLSLRLAGHAADPAAADAVGAEPVDGVESPPVPPLEPAGPMRQSASQALFGY